MITRLYTWEVRPPEGEDPIEVLDRVGAAADRVSTYNPEVDGIEVALDEAKGIIRVTVTFSGRDQWWIKKRIVYAIGAVLSLSGLRGAPTTLVALERPGDRRSTRQRASDGRSNPIPDDQDIDHSDLGLVTT
jgi:hypothetical protein